MLVLTRVSWDLGKCHGSSSTNNLSYHHVVNVSFNEKLLNFVTDVAAYCRRRSKIAVANALGYVIFVLMVQNGVWKCKDLAHKGEQLINFLVKPHPEFDALFSGWRKPSFRYHRSGDVFIMKVGPCWVRSSPILPKIFHSKSRCDWYHGLT